MIDRANYQLDLNWLPAPPARIHFVGIGGVGQSALARMLLSRGYQVSGSDITASPLTAALQAEGVEVTIGHNAGNVAGAQLIVITAAAKPTNPETMAGRAANIPVIKRAALLGLLSRSAMTLAVAGTHGKSTTSGMAAFAMTEGGLAPSFAVGAEIPQLGSNARLGDGNQFIVEADEYDYSFLWLEPRVAIITSIEHDHPDLFASLEDVLVAFREFVARIRPSGTLVISADDCGCRQLIEMLRGADDLTIVTYGEGEADWTVAADSTVTGPVGQALRLQLSVPGRHNRHNALAVLAAAEPLGLDPAMLISGLNQFQGVGRRFEIRRDDFSRTVIEDYAHHPTEIQATIEAARERYPGRRLLVVFQPHTYSRTRALLREFVEALDLADEIVLADIYPARETDDLGVSSVLIAKQMRTPATVGGSVEQTASVTLERCQEGDVVLVLGAGDIYRATAIIVEGA